MFIWTISDLIGVFFGTLCFLAFVALFAAIKIGDWRAARRRERENQRQS